MFHVGRVMRKQPKSIDFHCRKLEADGLLEIVRIAGKTDTTGRNQTSSVLLIPTYEARTALHQYRWLGAEEFLEGYKEG